MTPREWTDPRDGTTWTVFDLPGSPPILGDPPPLSPRIVFRTDHAEYEIEWGGRGDLVHLSDTELQSLLDRAIKEELRSGAYS